MEGHHLSSDTCKRNGAAKAAPEEVIDIEIRVQPDHAAVSAKKASISATSSSARRRSPARMTPSA